MTQEVPKAVHLDLEPYRHMAAEIMRIPPEEVTVSSAALDGTTPGIYAWRSGQLESGAILLAVLPFVRGPLPQWSAISFYERNVWATVDAILDSISHIAPEDHEMTKSKVAEQLLMLLSPVLKVSRLLDPVAHGKPYQDVEAAVWEELKKLGLYPPNTKAAETTSG